MWNRVWTFATQPSAYMSDTSSYARVIDADPTMNEIQYRLMGTEVVSTGFVMQGSCNMNSLACILRSNFDAVRVECGLPDSHRIVTLSLLLKEDHFDDVVIAGNVDFEVALVTFVCSSSKSSIPRLELHHTLIPEGEDGKGDLLLMEDERWNEEFRLFPHQHATVSRMYGMETFPDRRSVSVGMHTCLTDGWYVDTTNGACRTDCDGDHQNPALA